MTAGPGNRYIREAAFECPVGLIITSGERRNAMTVSMFSEAAHHPASMWVSIARDTLTHELVGRTGRFTFVTLHCRQAAVALACGSVSGRDRDKCAGLRLYEAGGGFWFLDDAIANVACEISHRTELGDHTLFTANMLHGTVETRRAGLRQLLISDLAAR